jgi:sigma-B regulation protein RsbU (phosphoserine phosphatase)
MQYAYPQGTAGDVQVIAKADDHQLTFTLIDAGIPFDPTAMKEADITLSAEERPIGGLGIHLVREIMDAVSYNRKDDKNILTLTKNIIS